MEHTLSDPCPSHLFAVAFTLVDIDGDGQVSKNDLVRYLELVTAAPEGVKIDLVSWSGAIGLRGVSCPVLRSVGEGRNRPFDACTY